MQQRRQNRAHGNDLQQAAQFGEADFLEQAGCAAASQNHNGEHRECGDQALDHSARELIGEEMFKHAGSTSCRSSDRLDPACFEHEDPVGHGPRLLRAVRYPEAGEMALANEALEKVLDAAAGCFVQCGGGFIEKEHLGLVGQGAGDRDTLGLSAGQGERVAVGIAGQADLREQLSISAPVMFLPCWRGPKAMFSATVPGKRYALCITMPIDRRRVDVSMLR